MLFVAIGVILVFIFQYNRVIDTKKFIVDATPSSAPSSGEFYMFYLPICF